jgi:hypothetical protein
VTVDLDRLKPDAQVRFTDRFEVVTLVSGYRWAVLAVLLRRALRAGKAVSYLAHRVRCAPAD